MEPTEINTHGPRNPVSRCVRFCSGPPPTRSITVLKDCPCEHSRLLAADMLQSLRV